MSQHWLRGCGAASQAHAAAPPDAAPGPPAAALTRVHEDHGGHGQQAHQRHPARAQGRRQQGMWVRGRATSGHRPGRPSAHQPCHAQQAAAPAPGTLPHLVLCSTPITRYRKTWQWAGQGGQQGS